MKPISFDPVLAPVSNDIADGQKAFNSLAAMIEANCDAINGAVGPTVPYYTATAAYDTDVISLASGWALTSPTVWRTYALTWGPYRFVAVCVTRTGAMISPNDNYGSLPPTGRVGTFAASWRPGGVTVIPHATYTTRCCLRMWIDGGGTLFLTGTNQSLVPIDPGDVVYLHAWWIIPE